MRFKHWPLTTDQQRLSVHPARGLTSLDPDLRPHCRFLLLLSNPELFMLIALLLWRQTSLQTRACAQHALTQTAKHHTAGLGRGRGFPLASRGPSLGLCLLSSFALVRGLLLRCIPLLWRGLLAGCIVCCEALKGCNVALQRRAGFNACWLGCSSSTRGSLGCSS